MRNLLPLLSMLWLLGQAGCAPTEPATLVVATDLTASECEPILAAVRQAWPDGAGPRIEWVRTTSGEPPTVFLEHGARVDVVAGGPVASYQALSRRGLLKEGDWGRFERPSVGVVARLDQFEARALVTPDNPNILDSPAMFGLVGLDDPRQCAASRGLVREWLGDPRHSREGYASLLLAGANAVPIRMLPGNSRAQLARGEIALAPMISGAETGASPVKMLGAVPGPIECVAIVPTTTSRELARRFVAILTERYAIGNQAIRDACPLFDDLLGATLVDAQPELVRARQAVLRLEAGARATELERLLVEPPPWPPASIQKLRARDPSEALVEALAAEITSGLDTRGWLLQSWEQPPRPLDVAMLQTIAGAVGGKLADDPRFRSWLRAEWTAWARQRYRRVAREAEKHASERS